MDATSLKNLSELRSSTAAGRRFRSELWGFYFYFFSNTLVPRISLAHASFVVSHTEFLLFFLFWISVLKRYVTGAGQKPRSAPFLPFYFVFSFGVCLLWVSAMHPETHPSRCSFPKMCRCKPCKRVREKEDSPWTWCFVFWNFWGSSCVRGIVEAVVVMSFFRTASKRDCVSVSCSLGRKEYFEASLSVQLRMDTRNRNTQGLKGTSLRHRYWGIFGRF